MSDPTSTKTQFEGGAPHLSASGGSAVGGFPPPAERGEDGRGVKTQFDIAAPGRQCHPEAAIQAKPKDLGRDSLRLRSGPERFLSKASATQGALPQNDVQVTNLLARAALYQLLSTLFRHPRSSNVRIDLEENANVWYAAVDQLSVPARGGLKQPLSLLLKDIRKTGDQEWIRQYENCFGHTAHAKVPAYELEYGEEHSHREPRELADIAAFYQAFGVHSAPSVHERADHVSVECEFMHFLLYKQAYAESLGEDDHARVCRDGSRSFLEHHLGRWLPAFASRLSRHASGDLMKQIADFVLAFIHVDCETQGLKAGRRDLPVRVIDEKQDTECVSCQYGPAALS